MLGKRIGEARLDQVADPRHARGRRWALDTLLGGALLGLMAGCKSLAETEQLTDELTPAVRSKLGRHSVLLVGRAAGLRVPDQTWTRRRPFDEPMIPPGAAKNAAPGGVSALQ